MRAKTIRKAVQFKEVQREYQLLALNLQRVLEWYPGDEWSLWMVLRDTGEYHVGLIRTGEGSFVPEYRYDVPIANHLDIAAARYGGDSCNGYVGKGHRAVLQFFKGANEALLHLEDAGVFVGNHEKSAKSGPSERLLPH